MLMLKELFVKICEEQGWNVAECSDGYELSKYSPMGEDFSFFIGENDIKSGVQDYYEDFDPEEHAAKWFDAKRRGEGSVPGSLRNLLDDADAIDEMLRELANAIEEAQTIVVRAYDIQWDTDGEDIEIPAEVELEVDVSDMEDEEELADYISDHISDETGWCHNGCSWEVKKAKKVE